MDALRSRDPETAALFRRADEALWESRRLIAAIQSQREQAQGRLQHLHQIGAEFERPSRILYPRDTVDARL